MPTASTETTRATTRSASRKKNTAFQLNAMGAAKTEAKQQAAAVPTHPPFLHLLLLDLLLSILLTNITKLKMTSPLLGH